MCLCFCLSHLLRCPIGAIAISHMTLNNIKTERVHLEDIYVSVLPSRLVFKSVETCVAVTIFCVCVCCSNCTNSVDLRDSDKYAAVIAATACTRARSFGWFHVTLVRWRGGGRGGGCLRRGQRTFLCVPFFSGRHAPILQIHAFTVWCVVFCA